MKKTEIVILSGFLGSGKTTLLQQLLKEEKHKDSHVGVLMNEAGSVSIDSTAIPDSTPLKELLSGCVCCSIQSALEPQLLALCEEYTLDKIYIETSGVAHPIEVLDGCLTPTVAEVATVKGIITTVDLMRYTNQKKISIKMRKLLKEQIKHADFLYFTKKESVTEEQQLDILAEIREINPHSIQLTDPKELFTLDFALHNRKQSNEKLHVEKDLHIKTFVYHLETSLMKSEFIEWLERLPSTIYRIKGFLYLDDDFYSIQYSFSMPTLVKETREFPSNLVFIGENLDTDKLDKELKQLEK
ncbi:CobW family GTP-binding protein [Bacillus sp. FJAT-45350]|uniref:CobW family GTP-binding protein n=1 Tax=Bacillus sp. FJAT-45350 TaxID=2011014 RepID=UPI000BB7F6ED|nr:GTP-binding protein [Bacillus sp. FJAT-45350]